MRWSTGLWIISIASFCRTAANAHDSPSAANSPVDGEKVRYDNFRLYRIRPVTQEHYRILKAMDEEEGYSFWNHVKTVDDGAVVLVTPGKLTEFQALVNQRHMEVDELMDDVQRFIDHENPLSQLRGAFEWNAYHGLEEICGWMDSLAKRYPNLISPLVGGESYEGRNISGVKLSFREGNPGVFIEAGMHAREWIAPAVTTYILNELITSADAKVRAVAESYDWYVFPVFNPDGYVYTHKTDRLWRKTRQPYPSGCYGADPNRNWDFHWKVIGASSQPCSETFAGGAAFSEKETLTASKYISSIRNKIFAYIAFHSFSQIILLPYGYTSARVPNYDDLIRIGNASAIALAKRYGTLFKVGNVVDILYPASGSSMDWVRGTLDIPVTLSYELRDQGGYGFFLPASQIIPSGEETLDSLVALLQEAKELGYGVRAN